MLLRSHKSFVPMAPSCLRLQGDRQTERQTDKQTERQTDRDRQTDRQTDRLPAH